MSGTIVDSLSELARRLDRSRTWAHEAVKKGLPKLADGRYSLDDVRSWMASQKDGRLREQRRARQEAQQETDAKADAVIAEVEAEKAAKQAQQQVFPQDRRGRTDRKVNVALGDQDPTDRYRRAKAEREELQVAQMKRQLVPRSEVLTLLVARASEFSRSLMLSARRMAPKIVGRDVREVQAELEAEARRILDIYARSGDDPLLQEVTVAEAEAASADDGEDLAMA